jgi:hypothetical protein
VLSRQFGRLWKLQEQTQVAETVHLWSIYRPNMDRDADDTSAEEIPLSDRLQIESTRMEIRDGVQRARPDL